MARGAGDLVMTMLSYDDGNHRLTTDAYCIRSLPKCGRCFFTTIVICDWRVVDFVDLRPATKSMFDFWKKKVPIHPKPGQRLSTFWQHFDKLLAEIAIRQILNNSTNIVISSLNYLRLICYLRSEELFRSRRAVEVLERELDAERAARVRFEQTAEATLSALEATARS